MPVLSALAVFFAFPPFDLAVLPFVSLVPLCVFIGERTPDGPGRRSSVRGGLVFGLVLYGLLFAWMPPALSGLGAWALPAYTAVVGALSVVAMVVAWAVHRISATGTAPLWIAFPMVWTAGEWFRAHWPGPFGLPWLGLGVSLTAHPEWIGMAEWVGERGLSFWIAAVNGLLAVAVIGARARARSPGAALGGRPVGAFILASILVAALPIGWGIWRAADIEMVPAARVALVQPNVSQALRAEADAGRDTTLAVLARLLPRIAPGSVDLVVLPEAAFGADPRGSGGMDSARTLLIEHAAALGAPILFGAIGSDADSLDGTVRFNSAFLAGSAGLTDYRYDKHFLVPLVERTPGLLPGAETGFEVGRGWPLGQAGAAAFGVLICYESIFPGASRTFRNVGADFLVNITNDGWFGRRAWYTRSPAIWQHPAHLVLRAIEHRVGVARAANTGISMFVDPSGRVSAATEWAREDVRIGVVMTTRGRTLYARIGDVFGLGAVLLTGAVLGLSTIPGRRASGRNLMTGTRLDRDAPTR